MLLRCPKIKTQKKALETVRRYVHLDIVKRYVHFFYVSDHWLVSQMYEWCILMAQLWEGISLIVCPLPIVVRGLLGMR